jgi:hypothetical protein
MLAFRTTGRFEKEFRLAVRRGKDVSKLQAVMRVLVKNLRTVVRLPPPPPTKSIGGIGLKSITTPRTDLRGAG